MSTPPHDAACRKDAGEQIAGNPHVMLQTGGIEIDVAVLVDGRQNGLLHGDGNVIPLGVAGFDSQST